MPHFAWWIITSIAFFILEILTPSFFFMWFGIGALIVVPLAIFFENVALEMIIFLISSGILWLSTRKIVSKWQQPESDKVFHLDELEGKIGIIIKKLDETNSGIVRVMGEEWKAFSTEGELKEGEKVKVVKREGNILYVKKAGGEEL